MHLSHTPLTHLTYADIPEYQESAFAQLRRLAASPDDLLPTRIQRRARPNTHRTVFPSVKAGTSFWCESKLESDFCLYTEANPAVVYYHAQPMIFRDNAFAPSGRYTPDFVLMDDNHRLTFIEVKVSSSHLLPTDLQRLNAVHYFLAARQLGFRVIYADTIRQQPHYRFLHEAHSRVKFVGKEGLNQFTTWLFDKGGATTLKEVRRAFPTYGIGYAALMLYRRMVLLNQLENGDLNFTVT